MKTRDSLDDWLAAARSDVAGRAPDLLAEQQLMTRVRELQALKSIEQARAAAPPANPSRRSVRLLRSPFTWRMPALWAVTAAAAALMVVVGLIWMTPATSERETSSRRPFLALVASEAIAAERSALIVPSQVSAAALADYGLPVDPARVDQPLRAEFLVSPTGLVLAIRFAE